MAKTLKDLPVGSIITYAGATIYNKPIRWMKLEDNHYGMNETTLIAKDIIKYMCVDAKEPRNSNSERRDFGNNRYIYSNIHQWLNSDKMSWYRDAHSTDQAPNEANVSNSRDNPYDNIPGLMNAWDRDFKEAILSTRLKVVKSSYDGDGSDFFNAKVFCLSRTEVGLGNESEAEGWPFAYFNSNSRRQAVSTAAANDNTTTSSRNSWWLRTPATRFPDATKLVGARGTLSQNSPYDGYIGIRAALNLPSSISASEKGNGEYVLFNALPTISGKDQDLGDISAAINYKYTVFDEDNDTLSVVERLNNEVIEVRNNVKSGSEFTATIGKEKIYSLELGKKNTLQIEVSDGTERVYRNITFTRINTAPIIQVLSKKNLGEIIKPFENIIKVTDIENDSVGIVYKTILVEKVNNDIKKTLIHQDEIDNINLNSELKYSIPQNIFSLLLNGDYELEITATDSQGGESKEVVKFTRTEDTIDYLSKVIETEIMAKQIMIMPTISGTPKSVKIMACNNAFDKAKTWEDVTNEALNMLPYSFKNTSKTAAKWGIQAQFILSGKGAK